MQGIVVVNKKEGWSSFDVVKKIKRIFNTSKVGHLGTLDPMAEGVLPVAIGRATKLFDYYLSKTKCYIAEFEFGYETDTLDREGEVIKTTNNIPSLAEVQGALENFRGKIMQTPPKYSAVKINGKRAYLLARENKEFEISAKEIEIFNLEILREVRKNTFEIKIGCSAGTYIRSLGRDIAYNLNSLATMTKLTRIRSGNFTIEKAKTIEEIESDPKSSLILTEEALSHLPQINLSENLLSKLINGVQVDKTGKEGELSQILVGSTLFGLGMIKTNKVVVTTRLYEGENNG